MAGKPAAFVGSATQHNPVAGPGSPDVWVHGSFAWTTGAQTPCAVHGPEAVVAGAELVLINNKLAARVGDYLLGAGPPNRIMVGADDVQIGSPDPVPFDMDKFCELYCALKRDWSSLSPAERQARYQDLCAQMFADFGSPAPKVKDDVEGPAADATWDPETWTVGVPKGAWNDPDGPPSGDSTSHEIRHGAQTTYAVRANGGPGVANIPADVQKSLASEPIDPNSAAGRYGRVHADNELKQPGVDNLQKIIGNLDTTATPDGETPAYRAAVQAYYDQPGGADAQGVEEPGKCGGCA